jgi:hypothetical protein
MLTDAKDAMWLGIAAGSCEILGGMGGLSDKFGDAYMTMGKGAGSITSSVAGFYSTKAQADDQKAQAEAGYQQAASQATSQMGQGAEKAAGDLWQYAQTLIQSLNEMAAAANQARIAAAGR